MVSYKIVTTDVLCMIRGIRRIRVAGFIKIMQQLIKLHVSTPWGHLQVYKIWYHTRYICCYYLRYPVVYSTLVIKMWYIKNFYKPEDDPMGSKHVAVIILA